MAEDQVSVELGIHVSDNPEAFLRTVEALRQHAPAGVRITVLADAPDPATGVSIRRTGLPFLEEAEPRGAPALLNRFFRETTAPVVIYLENGALVFPNTLQLLLNALAGDARIGLAGPSTNRAWNEQGGHTNPDRLMSGLRTLEPLYSLCSFCYAVKREVFDAVRGFDEAYGLGPCWEMDFNIRAARRGYRGVWVCSAYVHCLEQSIRRRAVESMLLEPSKKLYQDRFCGRRLRGENGAYRNHCCGDSCRNFAPVQIQTPTGSVKVTCIMPTAGRRAFIPQAIASFLQQDYRDSELLILDDGLDPVADLVPQNPRIRYVRFPHKKLLGDKRNEGCKLARGSIIVHWDDDDWYPSWRVLRQVEAIEAGAEVCGSSQLFFYDPERSLAFRYSFSGGSPWVAGSTLAYRRSVWQCSPFPGIQVGEDSRFLWTGPSKKIHDLADPRLCVARIHRSNTSPKSPSPPCWMPVSVDEVRAIVRDYTPSQPLVSCIMPTRNRRSFLPLTVRLFRAQDYPSKELIVIDDSDEPVADLFAGQDDVRYLRVAPSMTIGEKRNRGYAESRGGVLVHWDDDDWYSPERVRLQVDPILAGNADLNGLHSFHTLVLETGDCWEPTAALHRRMFVGDVHGGTLAFHRQLYEQGIRCPHVSLAEDAAFLRQALQQGKKLEKTSVRGLHVYMRHGRNAWRFQSGEFLDPSGWHRTSLPEAFAPDCLADFRNAAQQLSAGSLGLGR